MRAGRKRLVNAAGEKEVLAQRVFDGLRSEIAAGRLGPGALLSRRRIAERYGVSYTPVIEALVRLQQTGLIEAAATQTARVREVTLESIESDYVVRSAVEVEAIRLACKAA